MPMPQRFFGRLEGRTALLTGAGCEGEGFGIKAISFHFAMEDARVCLVDRDRHRAEETRDAILARGGEATAICGDVTSADDTKMMA